MSESEIRAQKIDRYYRKQVITKLEDLLTMMEPSGASYAAYTYSELLEAAINALNAERRLIAGE